MFKIKQISPIVFQEISQQCYIYDVKDNIWTEGPPLLTPRCHHSGCAIKSEDGSIQSIIITGGMTDNEYWSTDTEILDLKEQRWIKGPNLPLGIHEASCVALPPTLDFACLLIGGKSHGLTVESVYGLKKSLDEWIFRGDFFDWITNSIGIALPYS